MALTEKSPAQLFQDDIISRMTPKNVTINFMYFLMNYPPGFIQKCWHDNQHLAGHFQEKFNNSYDRFGSTAGPLRFFFELSSDNQEKLINWVTHNYNHK